MTDTGGWVLVQAKSGLGLGTTSESPLAKAVDQVVDQFRQGVPYDAGTRALEPGRDLLLIATDLAAPLAVRKHLAAAIARLGTEPAGTDLTSAAVNNDEAAPLDTFLGHLRRSWSKRTGAEPGDETIRAVFRVLRLVSVDLNGGAEQESAEQVLDSVLVHPGSAGTAWPVLITYAHVLSEERRWGDLGDAAAALLTAGHPVGPIPALRADIGRLGRWTEDNLRVLADADVLVAGSEEVRVRRSIDTDLAGMHGALLVVGDAGGGKTGAVVRLARRLRADGGDVVWLQAEDLQPGGPTGLRLDRPLHEVLGGWTGAGPATLVVDGLDAVRGSVDHGALVRLTRQLAGTRWRVIGTVRLWNARHSPELRAAFPGSPISPEPARRDPALSTVSHLLVDELIDAELAEVSGTLPALRPLLDAADPRLRPLLRNPFNLRLAAGIVGSSGSVAGFAAVHTRLDLLRLYWEQRAARDSGEAAELLGRISAAMLQSRRLVVVAPGTDIGRTDLAVLDRLLHNGVLRQRPTAVAATARAVEFAHNVLFDYAVAVCVLADPLDPLSAATSIDRDPSLPLVARPSLDMHFESLWTANRDGFWRLVLRFAGSSDQLLASLAGAASLVRLGPSSTDLRPLVDAALGPSEHRGPASAVIRQAAGALGASYLPEHLVHEALPGFASLARVIAAQARRNPEDMDSAWLALEVVRTVERLHTAEVGQVAEDSAAAIADLMFVALAEPGGRETFAGHVAQLLPGAASLDVEAVAAIRAAAEPAVTAVWGVTVLDRLADQINTLVGVDPGLGLLIVSRLWTYEEVRGEEKTFALATPLLGMTSTRQQDLQMARWQVGRQFPAVCATDPVAATQMFAHVTGHGLEPEPDTEERWPLAWHNTTGSLVSDHRFDRYADHGALRDMRSALVACLRTLDDAATFDRCLDVLVMSVSNTEVWKALLAAGLDNSRYASRMLPLLPTGSLLAHWATRHAAAGCLVAASRTDAAVVRPAIDAMRGRLLAAGVPAHRHEDAVGEVLSHFTPDDLLDPELAAQRQALPDVVTIDEAELLADPDSGELVGGDPAPDTGDPMAALLHVVQTAESADAGSRSSYWQELGRALTEAMSRTNPFEDQEEQLVLVRATALLAADPSVVPGSPIGDLVEKVLLKDGDDDE